MLRESLYRLLGRTAGSSFNALNFLLRGNLPPFGSACVVIKEKDLYLLLVQEHGKTVLPGGFMRWREDPLDTARRECEEETGLRVNIQDMIGCFSCPSDEAWQMSTLTLVYSAQIAGGRLHRALEGRPVWCSETEALHRLELRSRRFFEGYLRYYRQSVDAAVDMKIAHPAPISERI